MKSSTEADSRLVCMVCSKQFSRYVCPRCNVRYCSLPCYKSHSARCVESFCRDNVLADMSDCVATPETRRRMLEALHRFHSDDSMGDGDDADDDGGYVSRTRKCVLSDATLNKMAAEMDIQLDDLSEEEQKAFSQALMTGEFSHMIIPWEPWWLSPLASQIVLSKDGMRVVQPLKPSDTAGSNEFNLPAPLDSPLPPLRDLTSRTPSSLLGVHLVEVLYSYCFMLRFFNGDWTCDTFQAAWICLSVSHTLSKLSFPETISEALNNCFVTICSPYFKSIGGLKFGLALVDDLITLLHVGRPGVICALSDLHRLLERAVKDSKREGSSPTISERKGHQRFNVAQGVQKMNVAGRSDLKAACKKVFFLLCWANEQPSEAISSLALFVEDEKAYVIKRQENVGHDIGTNMRS